MAGGASWNGHGPPSAKLSEPRSIPGNSGNLAKAAASSITQKPYVVVGYALEVDNHIAAKQRITVLANGRLWVYFSPGCVLL
jgi:hypothetical protein